MPASDEPEVEVDPSAASPVRLIPRLELRYTFARLSTGASVNTTTVQMDVEFFRRALLRWELPLPRVTTRDGQVSGVGDISLQAITLLSSGARQVSVLLTGVVLDTASAPVLGAGKQQLFVGAAGAVKPLSWWLPYLLAQEQFSVAGDSKRPGVNQFLVRLGNLAFTGRVQWFKLDLDTVFDFHDDNQRLYGTLEAGSLVFGSVGLFVRGGSQLAGPRELDYNLQAGLRYLFQLEKSR
jgi:hypothetical protein